MTRPLKFIGSALRAGSATLLAFALWSLWLALGGLLVVQSYILFTSELAVPDFALRRFERRIAEAGLRATFARTSFDPTGRMLVEDVRVSLPEFAEPVLTVRSVYIQFNPWWLAVGRFEPEEIRLHGARATVPAMLSPSGRAEDVIRDLDATIVPRAHLIDLPQFSAQVAGVTLTAQGALAVAPFVIKSRPGESLAELVSTQFPVVCRQVIAIAGQLETLEAPALDLKLIPSDTRGAIIHADFLAKGLTLNTPLPLALRGLHATAELPLLGPPAVTTRLEISVAAVNAPERGEAHEVHASLAGSFRPGGFQFDPRDIKVTADSLASRGFSARALSATFVPQPLPKLDADLVAQLMGEPLAVQARADFSDRTAILRFSGPISPHVLTPLSTLLKTEVRQYFDFAALDCRAGVVQLGPDWKFEKVTAEVEAQGIDAYHVRIDEGRATVELDPRRFYSPRAYGRIGGNFARGSYEHDLQTHQFRFLLAGQLRPLAISGWFRAWWPNFFRQFDFQAAAPAASVDAGGFWREGRRSAIFVFADVAHPVIRGAALDRVRTRLFIRPGFYDGLEMLATHSTGLAQGTFTYSVMPETFAWRRLDLDLASTLDPALAAGIIGPIADPVLNQFKYAHPPTLKVTGRIDGAASPGGAHQTIQIDASSRGEFRFHGFPLKDVSFAAALRDDEIAFDRFEARFAGGVASGKARIWGTGKERRVGFDTTLKDASLGLVASAVAGYVAEISGRPAVPPGKFVQEKANVRLDLAASAEGRYADPYSFQGSGNAILQGQEIGEVPLLGLLSELLKFTALRFTSARANFKIEGAKLAFPEVTLRGANSAIDAHGDYALDRRQLAFNARLYPFQQSDSLIKTVVGAVLAPISNVFEVKLTGTLEKPEWAFVIGPTNFLRALAPEAGAVGKPRGPVSAPEPDPTKGTVAPALPQAPDPATTNATPPPASTLPPATPAKP